MAAGIHSAWIPIAFWMSKWGEVGHRSFGSFEGLVFVTPLLLACALLGLHVRHGAVMGRVGRLGLLLAASGKLLAAIGNFGGCWLGFARSGNYVAFPGAVLAFSGLVLFGVVAIRTKQPLARGNWLPLLISVLPVFFIGLRGLDIFLSVPMLSETALAGMYSISVGVLWLMLGRSVWTDRTRPRPSA